MPRRLLRRFWRSWFSMDAWVLLAFVLCWATALAYVKFSRPGLREVTVFEEKLRVVLPAGWNGERVGNDFEVRRPTFGEETARVAIERIHSNAPMDIPVEAITRNRSEEGFAYRVLASEETACFGNEDCLVVDYAMVVEPEGTVHGDAVVPVVITGRDSLVRYDPHTHFLVAERRPTNIPNHDDQALEAILRSLQLKRSR